jgi:ABC-type phosphate transport system ATPase subunit
MLIIILFLILMVLFSLTYLSDIKVSGGLTLLSKILSLGPMLSSILQMMFVGYIYIIMKRTGNFCGSVIDNVALKIEKVQSSISNLELFEKVTEMASISQEYKENLLKEITELSSGNLKQTKEAFMNMLVHAKGNNKYAFTTYINI